MLSNTPQVTLLPAQWRRLASEAEAEGSTIGISQTGSVVRVFTGARTFDIDAQGEDIKHPLQERLC
jgi:hypothetical protein